MKPRKCRSIEENLELYTYPEPNTGCWLWGGPADVDGYGIIFIGRIEGKHTKIRAHRAAYQQSTGQKIDSNTYVCHRCDIPSCVNPDHLFEGSNLDNIKDMINKNRQVRGERQHSAKLTEKGVLEIRELRKEYELTYKQLSELYGMSIYAIASVVTRKTWKHI